MGDQAGTRQTTTDTADNELKKAEKEKGTGRQESRHKGPAWQKSGAGPSGSAKQKDGGNQHHSREPQERQERTEHTNERQGAKRSSLDLSLKEAIEGDCFNSRDKEFQHLGAMHFIDLGSERLT